jgi:ribosomal protein L29
MKRKDIQKLHQSSIEELRGKIIQIRKELVNLRMAAGKEKTKDVKAIKKKRGELARVMTILREKEFLEEDKPSDAEAMEGKDKNEKA